MTVSLAINASQWDITPRSAPTGHKQRSVLYVFQELYTNHISNTTTTYPKVSTVEEHKKKLTGQQNDNADRARVLNHKLRRPDKAEFLFHVICGPN